MLIEKVQKFFFISFIVRHNDVYQIFGWVPFDILYKTQMPLLIIYNTI